MINIQTITLPADTSVLNELRSFILRTAASLGIDPTMLSELELAADEAATNVIEHVASEMPCDIFCRCEINIDLHVAICEISWPSAEPFRPDTLPEFNDIRQRLESRQPGGLGIFLIHTLVDEIEYDYENGRSVMRMIKKLG